MRRRKQDDSLASRLPLQVAGLLLSLLLVPGLAAAVEKQSDADPAGEFAAIRTFGWMTRPMEVPDAERRSPILDRLLRETVAGELEARDVKPAAEEQADLLFIYYVDPRANLEFYSRHYVTEEMATWLRPVKAYKEAMSVVVIDGISGDQDRLIWRGVFAMKLDDPWALAKKIRRVTAGLIRSIPIPEQ